MKQIVFILVIILLIGCETVNENINHPVIGEPSKPDEIVNPLNVTLTAEQTEAELILNTSLYCKAEGGSKNYNYTWSNECKTSECKLTIKKIGEHEISCTVNDGNEKVIKTITLEVKKQEVDIKYIISYGDSLTEGYLLDNPETENWISVYSKNMNAELINNAHTGDATIDVIKTQMRNAIPEGNKLIFLWIGANNILRVDSVKKFSDEYNQIVNNLTQIPNSEVLLMTIPDASKLSTATKIEEGINQIFGVDTNITNIGKEIIKSYNQVIWSTSEQYNLNTIDLFTYMDENFDESLEGNDKFHPNKKGHELIAQKVLQDMREFYPKKEFK